jgi:hypothetical protein
MQYRELMKQNDSLPEVIDYVLNHGVKANSTRSDLMTDLHVLLEEKTEQMVKWLFESLAPSMRMEAQKLEREQKPPGGKILSS